MTNRIPDQPDSIDPYTIAADLMTSAARDITLTDICAHMGQAYDIPTVEEFGGLADRALDLVRSAGIDLIWPDGTRDTELDAQRVENQRIAAHRDQLRIERDDARAEVDRLREQVFAQNPVIDAAQAWAELLETDGSAPDLASKLIDIHQAVEQYRVMDLALTNARNGQPGATEAGHDHDPIECVCELTDADRPTATEAVTR